MIVMSNINASLATRLDLMPTSTLLIHDHESIK